MVAINKLPFRKIIVLGGSALFLVFIISFYWYFRSFKPVLAVRAIDKIRDQKTARLSYALENKAFRIFQVIYSDSAANTDYNPNDNFGQMVTSIQNNKSLLERQLAFYGLTIFDTPNGKALSYKKSQDLNSANAILIKDIFNDNGENVLINPASNNIHYNPSIYQAFYKALPIDLINILSPNIKRVHQRLGASRSFFASNIQKILGNTPEENENGFTSQKLQEHNYQKFLNNMRYAISNEKTFGFPFWSQTPSDYQSVFSGTNNDQKKAVFCHLRDIVIYLNQLIKVQRDQTLGNAALKAYSIADMIRGGRYNNEELQALILNSNVNKAKDFKNQLPEDLSNQIIDDYRLLTNGAENGFEKISSEIYNSNGVYGADDLSSALKDIDNFVDTNLATFTTGECGTFKTYNERINETLSDNLLNSIGALSANQSLSTILDKTVTFFNQKVDITDANSIPLNHLLQQDYYSLVFAGAEAANNEYSRGMGAELLSPEQFQELDKQVLRHYFALAKNPNPNIIERFSANPWRTVVDLLNFPKPSLAAEENKINFGGNSSNDIYGLDYYYGFSPQSILDLGKMTTDDTKRASYEECYLTHDAYIILKGRPENNPPLACKDLYRPESTNYQEFTDHGNWFLSCQVSFEINNWVRTDNADWSTDPCSSYVNNPVCTPSEAINDPLWPKQQEFYDGKAC